jgi:thymidylate synthase
MLDVLLSADGNHSGTYFSRMITWPGKSAGGINQIADRIASLRRQREQGRATFNAMDIDLAGDAESGHHHPDAVRGLQLYTITDHRTRGFPCLTHIDLSLSRGQLHMTAVYRHEFLVSKAYGNFLGLSWLLRFIADQTGFEVGEILINATMADAEYGVVGRGRVLQLARDLRAVLDAECKS